ncbi:MAG: helix-turn-helix transcriptional regulator [Bacteroidota bacterium]
MISDLKNVRFDHSKHPGKAFEIVPLESVIHRADLDHDHLSPHLIRFYLMILVVEGSGKHTIDFVEHTYKKGTILTVRKDQIHSFHLSDARGYLLLFTDEFVLSFLENSSVQKVKALFNELLFPQVSLLTSQHYEECLMILDEISNEFYQYADDHSNGIVRSLLQVLANKVYRSRSASQVAKDHKYMGLFLKLQELIEQNCKSHRSVKYYANELNTTTKTLNSITQYVLNKSPKTLIDEILMLQIKRQLINTDLSIKEIAYQSGFDEPSNLFKFFRRFSTQTPEQFRDTHAI